MEDSEFLDWRMFKKLFFILVVLSVMLSIASPSHALWWMGYHKPAFHGRVIDAETKEPIEGAVVVAVYEKDVYAIIQVNSSVINVRETLTDKNGDFHIPSYTTIIQPLSWEGLAQFIIYKPGYGSYPNFRVKPQLDIPLSALEKFFSREPIGTIGELQWSIGKAEVTFGVVELPKLKTREERLMATVLHTPVGYTSKHLPLLYKALNEEYRRFGLGEER